MEDAQKKLATSGACFVWRIVLISPVHASNRLERAENQAEILVKTTLVTVACFFTEQTSYCCDWGEILVVLNEYYKTLSLRQEKTSLVRIVNSLGFSAEKQRTLLTTPQIFATYATFTLVHYAKGILKKRSFLSSFFLCGRSLTWSLHISLTTWWVECWNFIVDYVIVPLVPLMFSIQMFLISRKFCVGERSVNDCLFS